MKRLLASVAALMISAAAVLPSSAMAQVSVGINIGTPPPPLRYERVPPPRHGYVWAPGYWGWNGHTHVWFNGHWEHVRAGYIYERPAWRQDHGRWYFHEGRWRPGRHGHR